MNPEIADHPMTRVFDPRRLTGRLFYLLISLLLALGTARALPPTTTTISDTVYRADGTPASGTLLITWPQFNTADNKAVASGTMNVIIGTGGVVSIPLAPNTGASPAGTFYKVTYKLDDGTSSTEYWTVPAISPTTIAAIRSTVVPASMAVQVVSRSYVDGGLALKAADNAVVHKSGDTMTGLLSLSGDPTSATQAATKNYVDGGLTAKAADTAVVHKSGDTMSGALTLSGDPSSSLQAATKSYVDAHSGGSTPGQFVVDGAAYANIHAAVVAAGTNGSVLIPANYAGSDTDPNPNKIQIIDMRGKPNRQRGFINVLTDCGLKGDGSTDDAAAAQACLNAYPSWTFWFPPTKTDGSCSYWFTGTLKPVGEGTTITGGSSGFKNTAGIQGGTNLCFAAGVTGIELDLTGSNCSGCNIRDISLNGSEGTDGLVTPTKLNIPSGANLPLFKRTITSIQRAANILTVNTSRPGSEGLTQQVGSTVKISGVVSDTTMNGSCVIATLVAGTGTSTNPTQFTCAQNGADAGPFVEGTVNLPTTGASTADGIRICTNFATVNHVVVANFGRHGINADSASQDALCPSPFSDDLVLRDSFLLRNQGDGYLCNGGDCNAHLLSGNSVYYNVLWGLEDQSSLGNTHIGNQLSNGGHLWASPTTPPTKAISTVSRTLTGGESTVAVVLSAADTNLKLGSCVVIAGVTDASFNTTAGQCFFVTSFTDSTHFSYIQPGAPVNASSSGGSERMAKFSEAYLSSGVDDGAQKIATQSAVAQPTVLNQYVEGGQGCKFSVNTILLGGANSPGCATSADWIGRYFTTQGVSGVGGTLASNIGLLLSDANSDYLLSFRAGNSAAATPRDIVLRWTKYDNSIGWTIDGGTGGTNGDTSTWILNRNGSASGRRLGLWGVNNSGGVTILNSEGSGPVRFNTDAGAGTGGELFGDGVGNTVASVSSSGLGTFNGGVVGASLRSQTANVATSGAVRLAKTDSINFRNNANSADVAALSLNASDQAVLPTVASLTSAGNVTAPAVVSSTANPASAGQVRLAQADSVKFRNNANAADLTVLSESADVLQVGEATNGINVPGPAGFVNLTASGTVTGASISTGGDSFAGTPRIAWGSFLPGALTTTWTAAQFTAKKAISVVQIDLRAKTAPAGCTTFPVVQITDGTTPINVTLNSAGVSQTVAGQNYALNATVQVKVSTAGAGCTTNASDVNVTVQYKMQ